jgi:ribonuclease E
VSGWFAGKDIMAKKMLIDATHPEETRVVVVDGTKVEEFDFESLSKRQLAGNIYLAKVTRVEPSLQAAFVDYGGNRHGFLAFSEIHPDYYQIPVADREALLAEEREYAEAMAAEAEEEVKPKRRRSRRRKPNGTKAEATDADAVTRGTPSGMDVVEPRRRIRGWRCRHASG